VTAYHLAAAGIGATFVSDLLIRDSDQELNYYKIDSNLVTRQFYALLPKRKYVSVAARRFIEHFQESSFGAELYK
jgi:DNA-binding transcriptional LysR family regulator